jgi:HEAT repeat protein
MLEQTLHALADPAKSLPHKLLRSLSGLDPAGLAEVRQAWPAITVARRRQVTRALVEIAEDDAEMDFIDLFRDLLADDDSEVRATAASGLWETTDERCLDQLLDLLARDPSADVRAAAAITLGHFSMLAADGQLHGSHPKRLRRALLDAFHAVDDPINTLDVRRNALEAAAFFSEDEEVDEAIEQAYDHPEVDMRASAVSAMGFTFDERWEPIILRELDSPEPEMRFEAARSAGDMLIESAVPSLVAMTSDDDVEARLMAIWALGEIGGPQAKASLTVLLESHDEATRDAAEEALDELRVNENPLGLDDLLRSNKGKQPKK